MWLHPLLAIELWLGGLAFKAIVNVSVQILGLPDPLLFNSILSRIGCLPGCFTCTNFGRHMTLESAASHPLGDPLINQAASPLSPLLWRVRYRFEWARQLLMLLIDRYLRETCCLPVLWLIRCIRGGALEEFLELGDGRIVSP